MYPAFSALRSLETFLRGMETYDFDRVLSFVAALETFLRGMETMAGSVEGQPEWILETFLRGMETAGRLFCFLDFAAP